MQRDPASPLQIDAYLDGVIATVIVTGELDTATAPGLMDRLLTVAGADPGLLVLDLSGLVFVDVAGARALDETYTLLRVVCPVILRAPGPSVRKVFGLTGLMGISRPVPYLLAARFDLAAAPRCFRINLRRPWI